LRSTSTARTHRAAALLDQGGIEGSAVWRAIVRAIKELRRERGPGEAVN
jgi:hypothetical protein